MTPHHRGPSVVTSVAASSASVGPVPNAGQSRASGQAPHAGFLAWQQRRPCQITWCDSIVQSRRGEEGRRSRASTLSGSVSCGPAEAPHQAAEVRVDRDARDVEGVAQHDVGRLAPYAGKRDEVLETPGHLAVEAIAERLPQADDRRRLVAEEAGRADERPRARRGRHRRRRRRSG